MKQVIRGEKLSERVESKTTILLKEKRGKEKLYINQHHLGFIVIPTISKTNFLESEKLTSQWWSNGYSNAHEEVQVAPSLIELALFDAF